MTDHDARNPHLDVSPVRRGPSPDDASLVVVAVHGRGQSPQYMVDHLVTHLDRDDIHWVLPGAHGGSWYPLGFMAPLADNQPLLDGALAALDCIAAELQHLSPDRVMWAGFSQGACLVSEWVARHPQRWAGLLAFTGGRIGPEGTDLTIGQPAASLVTGSHVTGSLVTGRFDGMPAYFGTGAHDEWVPSDRVERTAAAYRAAGAEITVDIFDDHLHEIRPAEIAWAAALVQRATSQR